MRILFITTVSGSLSFCVPQIEMLVSQGHIVECACHETTPINPRISACGCKVHEISFSRNVHSKSNTTAYKQLKKLISEVSYDIVHTNTPIASFITRLVCRKYRRNGLKVIYTAHGFHFYKGAPLKNWLLYYPIEKLCAHWTDVLITINHEDYALAQKKMKAQTVCYVPGVGIDTERFRTTVVNNNAKRAEIDVPNNALLLLSVGELNQNKNHETVIKALAQIKRKDVHYAIAGQGELKEYLEKMAAGLDIAEQVHLLGFRTDVAELYKTADVFVHPSYREGLPVAIMEAMASGLPVVCSKIRGNADLIDKNSGMLFDPKNTDAFLKAIELLLNDTKMRDRIGQKNNDVVDKFGYKKVNRAMMDIYESILNQNENWSIR